MQNKFNAIPDYKELTYILNNESGRYEKQPERIPFHKLPFELKVEVTRDQKLISNGAKEIITGRIRNKERLFFTGLLKTTFDNWFFGNDYTFVNGKKKNSLIIFHFSNDNKELTIYYFNSYYKINPIERTMFVKNFISHIKTKEGITPLSSFNAINKVNLVNDRCKDNELL